MCFHLKKEKAPLHLLIKMKWQYLAFSIAGLCCSLLDNSDMQYHVVSVWAFDFNVAWNIRITIHSREKAQ